MKNIAMPWGAPFQGERLPLLLTSGTISPIEVLLEADWSRLNYMGLVGADLFGEDLKKEQWNRLIDATLLAGGNSMYDLLPAKVDAGDEPYTEWEPAIVDEPTYKLAEQLCRSSPKPVKMSKAGPAERVAASVKVLEEAGIAAIDVANPDLLHLITEGCACAYLPDGRRTVGDNDSGRMMRWVDKHYPKRKADILLPPPK